MSQEQIKSERDVLFLKFEDMCFDYDNQRSILYTFTGIDKKNHKQIMQKFKPQESANNVGLFNKETFKTMPGMGKAMQLIENNLGKYLF